MTQTRTTHQAARDAVFEAAFARCRYLSSDELSEAGDFADVVRDEIERLPRDVRTDLSLEARTLADEVKRACAAALETTRRMQTLMRGEL